MRERPIYDASGKMNYVMSVVRAAERARDDFLPRWEESWSNYLVSPTNEAHLSGRTDNPLARSVGPGVMPRRPGRAILKDPESHQVVESLLAETLTQLFPEDGFVKSRPTGGEDWRLAEGTNQIIEQTLGQPRHYRVIYQWVKDAFITGTGVLFGDWEFEEDQEIARVITDIQGFEVSQFSRTLTTVKDDVRLENVDVTDFYPVPGADNFQDLKGAARRVELFGPDLLKLAKDAPDEDGWDLSALEEAVELGFSKADSQEEFKDHLLEDDDDDPMSDFQPVVGFEYWGEVPWAGTEHDPIEDGAKRRRLLAVNGILVREQDWPLKRTQLPFFDITVNPMAGRLYGLSPLEVIRFDQDFADVLKQMLAMAVVKSVNPPHVINTNMGVSPAKVAAFRSDVPITTDGDVRQAFAQAPYAPPIQQADAIYQGIIKPQMRDAAGVQGGVQGQGLGSKRFSASEAQTTFRSQFARPNMIAQLIEKSSLPPLGVFVLDQSALNIEDNQTLLERYGEDFPVTLADLQNKHDVRFVGARREHDKLSKAAAMERFLSVVSQVPEIRANVPWDQFIKAYTKAIDLHDLAAMVGQDDVLSENAQLQAILGQFADGGRGGVSSPAGPASNAELEGGTLQ